MLSKKTEYALKALFYLAREGNGRPIPIGELAEKEDIPKKFLEAILLDVQRHGILESRKGKGGGYSLRVSPEEVTIGQIIRILDGPLAPVPCVSETAYRKCAHCRDEKLCGVRMVMKEVRDATAKIVDGTTLAQVVRRIKLEVAATGSARKRRSTGSRPQGAAIERRRR